MIYSCSKFRCLLFFVAWQVIAVHSSLSPAVFGFQNETVQGEKSASEEETKPKTFTEMIRENMDRESAEHSLSQQISAERSKTFGILSASAPESIRIPYEKSFSDFNSSLRDVRKIFLKHQVAFDGGMDIARLREFSRAAGISNDKLCEWTRQMAIAFDADPSSEDGLRKMMEEMVIVESSNDRFESVLPIAQSLWKSMKEETSTDQSTELLEAIGYTGFAMSDFQMAKEAWEKLDRIKPLSPKIRPLLTYLPRLERSWKRELEIREAESLKDDNPRVEILTNRGVVVVELFENQAPQAVANFIYLTEERNFYKRKTFFRVQEHLGAQTGCEHGDGTGDAGYGIPGEMKLDNRRTIFRGSLLFVIGVDKQSNQPNFDSGSSQFMITFMPQPRLDEVMTVFGRVIEGEEWLGTLERLDMSEEEQRKDKSNKPDFVIDAKVLRKRDHIYKPKISGGRLP